MSNKVTFVVSPVHLNISAIVFHFAFCGVVILDLHEIHYIAKSIRSPAVYELY